MKRQYTQDEVDAAVATYRANGNNALRTARQLGIPLPTLRGWVGTLKPTNGKAKKPNEEKVSERGAVLAERLDVIADTLVRRMAEAAERIPLETSNDLQRAAISTGITIEKASFARGGPTSRTETLRVSLMSPDSLRDGSLTVIEGGKRTSPAREADIA